MLRFSILSSINFLRFSFLSLLKSISKNTFVSTKNIISNPRHYVVAPLHLYISLTETPCNLKPLSSNLQGDTDIEKLKSVKDFNALVEYLRNELDWPIEVEDAEDITYDYEPKELGIEEKYAAKIKNIKQIRPLTDNQS
jgi:hypothetical protein